MQPNSRSARALGPRLAIWTIIAVLAPAVAVLGMGSWAYIQLGQGGSPGLIPIGTVGVDFTVLLAVAVAVIVVILVAIAVQRMRAALRNRVLELAEVCRQVSQGQLSLRARVSGQDEFSILAASVNALLDGTPLPGPRRTEATDANALQAQIEKLLQEVSAVGDGDLRVQAEVTPDTLGVLADSFNYMIEELGKVVGRVQATALQVTNATRRLLDRSAEVAQASETQALQINQTSDAVAQLADFVQLSATNALSAAEAARDALRNAHSGRQAVVQTIEGMDHIRGNVQDTAKKIKRLSERAQEVGEIVRLIEDIADQTNLLALNAAIQSAMAGENGRGFAVVADEIRALAERVSEATKRVTTLVKSIQGDPYEAVVAMEESTQEVVSGSKLADDAGRSLQSIYGSVERQAQIVESIATAAGERRQIAEAVAQSMSRIADIARQTNAATQDATISVSYLAELAEQLRASVATFRLPEQIAESVGIPPEQEPRYGPAMAPPALASPAPSAWNGGLAGVPSGAGVGMSTPGMGGFDDGFGGQMGQTGPVGAGYSPAYNQSVSPGYDQSYNPDFATSFAGRRGVAPEMGAAPLESLGYPQNAEPGAPMGVPRETGFPPSSQ
jgi:methyl-accepting chemotaxis protein